MFLGDVLSGLTLLTQEVIWTLIQRYSNVMDVRWTLKQRCVSGNIHKNSYYTVGQILRIAKQNLWRVLKQENIKNNDHQKHTLSEIISKLSNNAKNFNAMNLIFYEVRCYQSNNG